MIFLTEKIYDLQSILDILVYTTGKNGKAQHTVNGELVKVASLRLTTFKEKGVKCYSCDRVGTHFRLQRQEREPKFHLGLWTEDGIEMTKDHIVPKSKGGYDHIDNMQTMCEKCNGQKRNEVTPEEYERGYYKPQ